MSAETSPTISVQAGRRLFVWLNVLGGIAVLASYVVGIAMHPDSSGAVWGGVPESLQPLYTASMLLAAAGYFLFTSYAFFSLDAQSVRVFGRYGFGAINAIYAGILVPSALWMPLTFEMLAAPDRIVWLSIRIVLLIVGAASLALLAAVATAVPPGPKGSRSLAILGAVLFSFQTAVLDAVVWPAYFPL